MKIAVLPGDGIGPEISRVGVDVLAAVCGKFCHQVEFKTYLVGAAAIDATGNPFPEETLKGCQDADAVLFSAIGDRVSTMTPTPRCAPSRDCLPCASSWACLPTFAR